MSNENRGDRIVVTYDVRDLLDGMKSLIENGLTDLKGSVARMETKLDGKADARVVEDLERRLRIVEVAIGHQAHLSSDLIEIEHRVKDTEKYTTGSKAVDAFRRWVFPILISGGGIAIAVLTHFSG